MRTPLDNHGTTQIATVLTALLADTFASCVKVKNFHWHVTGPHFPGYHLLLDEQAGQVIGMVDSMAERARKLGRNTQRPIDDIARQQRVADNDAEYVAPQAMVAGLLSGNLQLADAMRKLHALCAGRGGVATASLFETRIDRGRGIRLVHAGNNAVPMSVDER